MDFVENAGHTPANDPHRISTEVTEQYHDNYFNYLYSLDSLEEDEDFTWFGVGGPG